MITTRQYVRRSPGDTKGNLTFIERMPGGQKWKCVCECGTEVIIQASSKQEMCKACSIKNQALQRTQHGKAIVDSRPRIYNIWLGMRSRCNNPNDTGYSNYGARGITVCQEWDDFVKFEKWSMENGYSETLTLDRIKNDGNYEPQNCRWITKLEQSRNKRNNHQVTIDGKTKCVMDWCQYLKVGKGNAYVRAKKKGILIEEYLEYLYKKRILHLEDKNGKEIQ